MRIYLLMLTVFLTSCISTDDGGENEFRYINRSSYDLSLIVLRDTLLSNTVLPDTVFLGKGDTLKDYSPADGWEGSLSFQGNSSSSVRIEFESEPKRSLTFEGEILSSDDIRGDFLSYQQINNIYEYIITDSLFLTADTSRVKK